MFCSMNLILRNSILLSIIVLAFASCRTAQWHIDKAKQKGAVFEPEIRYEKVVEHDTIINEITGETIVVERIDSIPYEVQKVRYVPLSRQERLMYRDSLKWAYKQMKIFADAYSEEMKINLKRDRIEEKTKRVEIRQEHKRSLWYVWFILGAIFSIILRLVVLPYLQGFLGKR